MSHSLPYHINGKSFTKEELLAHCHLMVHDCKNPDWYRKIFQFIELFLEPAEGPLLQRSSGTTGDPREFRMDRDSMEASARKTLSFFHLEPGERVLLCLPVDYIAGKMMVVRALVGGLNLVLTEPSSRPLEDISGDFSFVPMVPLQVLESLKAGEKLSRCGTLLIGGGELPDSVRARLENLSTPAVFESFGMTETYTHFGLKKINGPDAHQSFKLLDGVLINTDKRGCLVVDMPGVTLGPVVTNDLVEINGLKESDDLVEVNDQKESDDLVEVNDQKETGRDETDPAARYFRWLGRFDNVINTGGIKVIPELLEQRISALLQTTCLVLPRPDEKLGQKMVLMVEWPEPDAPVSDWKGLLSQHLAPHEIPKQFVPVPEIPRNASFKPDRRAASKLI
ncbi:MAG: AMP-binding protein [Bacteroidetes bacterium]|nr:AMP-binding protein [Bacteroidota bacterium]